MANRGYNLNQIGGSTPVKTSVQGYIYSEYQQTQHVPPPADYQQIPLGSNVQDGNLDRVNHIENRSAIVQKAPENHPIGASKDSIKVSKLARQHLLNARINVRKVYTLRFVIIWTTKIILNFF